MNNQPNPIDVLSNALDRANKAGVFGLAESYQIFVSISQLAEKLNQAEPDQKIKPMGDPEPHPNDNPVHPRPKP